MLDRVADELLEKESLDGDEVYATIAEMTGEQLDPMPRPRPEAAPPAPPTLPAPTARRARHPVAPRRDRPSIREATPA